MYPFLSPTVRFLYVSLKANTNLKKKKKKRKKNEKPDPNKGSISCKWKFM